MEDLDRYGLGPREELGSSSRFRSKPDLDTAFAAIARQLGHELQPEDQEPREYDIEPLLDFIARDGVKTAANIYRQSLEFADRPYSPANPAEVIKYLYGLRTRPPLRIADIGSVDDELVKQLGLKEEGYVEQLRELLTFLDADMPEISVLDFPGIRQNMLETQAQVLAKGIVQRILDEHGIAVVFDVEDPKAWSDLRDLAEDIANDDLREYSRYLRQRRGQEKRTPIRDVMATIDDRREIRKRAFELARDNVDSPPHERQRLLENLSPHMRRLVDGYLADFDAYKDDSETA